MKIYPVLRDDDSVFVSVCAFYTFLREFSGRVRNNEQKFFFWYLGMFSQVNNPRDEMCFLFRGTKTLWFSFSTQLFIAEILIEGNLDRVGPLEQRPTGIRKIHVDSEKTRKYNPDCLTFPPKSLSMAYINWFQGFYVGSRIKKL